MEVLARIVSGQFSVELQRLELISCDGQADDSSLELAPDEVRSYLDDTGFASVYLKAGTKREM